MLKKPNLIGEARIQDEDIARVIPVFGTDGEASVIFCICLALEAS